MSAYPQHDALTAIQPLSQACGSFLGWLEEQGYTVAERDSHGDLCPVRRSKQQLLADHFEIDLKALEAEKRAMLASINPAFAD